MIFARVFCLVFGITLLILGALCIANPLDTMSVLAYFVGFIMIFSGVGEVIYYTQKRHVIILLDGVLSCIFGLVLLFGDETISQNFVPLFIALWLMLKGFLWCIHTWRFSIYLNRNTKMGILLMGCFYIILGVVFCIFPNILATLISLMLGIALIISGAAGLYFWYIFKNTYE